MFVLLPLSRYRSGARADFVLSESQIHDLEYSPNGEKILVITGTTQPQVYDRDGEPRSVLLLHNGNLHRHYANDRSSFFFSQRWTRDQVRERRPLHS